MGTPREYFLGRNEDVIGLVCNDLSSREPHMSDLDMAQSMISRLHDAGLIVVSRDEWEKASALVAAVKALAVTGG